MSRPHFQRAELRVPGESELMYKKHFFWIVLVFCYLCVNYNKKNRWEKHQKRRFGLTDS